MTTVPAAAGADFGAGELTPIAGCAGDACGEGAALVAGVAAVGDAAAGLPAAAGMSDGTAACPWPALAWTAGVAPQAVAARTARTTPSLAVMSGPNACRASGFPANRRVLERRARRAR